MPSFRADASTIMTVTIDWTREIPTGARIVAADFLPEEEALSVLGVGYSDTEAVGRLALEENAKSGHVYKATNEVRLSDGQRLFAPIFVFVP